MFPLGSLAFTLILAIVAHADVPADEACVDNVDGNCFADKSFCHIHQKTYDLCPATCDTTKCPPGSCKDEVFDCGTYGKSCSSTDNLGKAMAKECRVTCNLCKKPPPKTFTCGDEDHRCRLAIAKPIMCTDSTFRLRCNATCAIDGCKDGCVDLVDNCATRTNNCYVMTVVGAVMRYECPATCRSCNFARMLPTTPADSSECNWDGNCLYEGSKMYCDNRKCVPFDQLKSCTQPEQDQLCDISTLNICTKTGEEWRCHMPLDP